MSEEQVLQGEPVSSAEEVAAVNVMYEVWIQDFIAHGLDGYVAHFTREGTFMPPKSMPVIGKPAVRSWMEAFGNHLTIQIDELVRDKIEVSGDLAYCRYHATGTYGIQSSGKVVAFDQKYLDVLKKQPDGTWKIAYHTWSSNNMLPSVWDKSWDDLADWE